MSDRQGVARDPAIAARVREALQGREQKEVAAQADVNFKTFNNFANGQMPAADKAIRCAQALGVAVEWLISGNGPRQPTRLALADETDWLFVPHLDLTKMMISGKRPEPEEVMPIRRDLVARHVANLNDLWITRMVGGALPTVAAPDDLILCRDVVDQLEEGRPYIVSWGDGLAFRRAYPLPDGLHLRPDEDATRYDEIFVPPAEADQVRPIARIIGSLAMRPAP